MLVAAERSELEFCTAVTETEPSHRGNSEMFILVLLRFHGFSCLRHFTFGEAPGVMQCCATSLAASVLTKR
jgi:hypothetical protein